MDVVSGTIDIKPNQKTSWIQIHLESSKDNIRQLYEGSLSAVTAWRKAYPELAKGSLKTANNLASSPN